MEYRPCIINENQKALFLDFAFYGTKRCITAVVQYEDGTVHCVNPQNLRFTDNKFNQIVNGKAKKATPKAKNTDYQKVIDLYNEMCGEKLPKVKNLTEARKKAIAKAADLINNDFMSLFERVNSSSFLTKEWKNCSFDWILKQSNLIKILEGNYDTQASTEESQSQEVSYGDLDEYEKYSMFD